MPGLAVRGAWSTATTAATRRSRRARRRTRWGLGPGIHRCLSHPTQFELSFLEFIWHHMTWRAYLPGTSGAAALSPAARRVTVVRGDFRTLVFRSQVPPGDAASVVDVASIIYLASLIDTASVTRLDLIARCGGSGGCCRIGSRRGGRGAASLSTCPRWRGRSTCTRQGAAG